MTKRMLIDATHAEETRVVVLDGNRLEDFDVETSTKKQLKGNIYLAKVIRVEPSLQAAFIEYGGNRHGFLAFSEIHPDYYQIPVADRQRLLEMQAGEARREEEQEAAADGEADAAPPAEAAAAAPAADGAPPADEAPAPEAAPEAGEPPAAETAAPSGEGEGGEAAATAEEAGDNGEEEPEVTDNLPPADVGVPATLSVGVETIASDAPPPETLGGEDAEESPGPRPAPRFLRQYKIQEVIRRRQILLVQVVKEERGNKGAALTTYISLAGRYCVLMPNSPHGGGISRKITSAADRKRLREVIDELDLSDGMGLIVRTAGAGRPKPEIKRDCEYLLRLWDSIRETTLNSTAPALIHEEANLIRRAIRDVYARDIEEILVDGEDAYRAAKDYMRMLMPSHARKVQAYRDGGVPLFAKAGVEHQLDAMHSSTVQLRSGGYLVINQTEALVAIDVNSGRATRERGIEETALRTNLEAAEELGRQLRLRDLAGLIVVDFIDMEARKHNAQVERKLKDALKNDRARIQVGHISHFGLLEMSRQRLRPSLAESSFIPCPHCNGTGLVRSIESSAVHVLRAIEEEGAKHRASEIKVHVAGQVALYILNHKRDRLGAIEERCGMRVLFDPDPALVPPQIRIDRVKAAAPAPAPAAEVVPAATQDAATQADDEAVAGDAEAADTAAKPPRRRRDGEARRAEPVAAEAGAEDEAADGEAVEAGDDGGEDGNGAAAESGASAENGEHPRRRRRGRRGGRRRRREGEAGAPASAGAEEAADLSAAADAPAWSGPTPADPYGGVDIFDVMEAAEQGGEDAGPAPAPEVASAATPAGEPAPAEAEAPASLPAAEGLATPAMAPEPVAAEVAVSQEAAPVAVPPAPEPAPETAAAEVPFPPVLPVAEPHPFEAEPVAPPAPAAAENVGAPATPAPAEAPAPAASSVVQPVLIDGSDESASKRRGWWRR